MIAGNPTRTGIAVPPSDRIAVIGAGHVGATAAFALMLRALTREIVLVDHDHARAAAEASDIADANALARPATIWAGDYADAAAARVAVITAGTATQGAQSRLEVLSSSAAIVRSCVTQLCGAGFTGVLVIASNPVDLMTMVALECSGLPPERVIGTGTLLDTSRLRVALAQQLGVAPNAVHAQVLGEHGDSEVALFSSARIGGVTLAEFSPEGRDLDQPALTESVRTAAYGLLAGKGYTSFGVAAAIVRICEAIVRDENALLPVSSRLTDPDGLPDICMSLPCIVGAAGIEQVLNPATNPAEAAALAASAAKLRAAYAAHLAGQKVAIADE